MIHDSWQWILYWIFWQGVFSIVTRVFQLSFSLLYIYRQSKQIQVNIRTSYLQHYFFHHSSTPFQTFIFSFFYCRRRETEDMIVIPVPVIPLSKCVLYIVSVFAMHETCHCQFGVRPRSNEFCLFFSRWWNRQVLCLNGYHLVKREYLFLSVSMLSLLTIKPNNLTFSLKMYVARRWRTIIEKMERLVNGKSLLLHFFYLVQSCSNQKS